MTEQNTKLINLSKGDKKKIRRMVETVDDLQQERQDTQRILRLMGEQEIIIQEDWQRLVNRDYDLQRQIAKLRSAMARLVKDRAMAFTHHIAVDSDHVVNVEPVTDLVDDVNCPNCLKQLGVIEYAN